MQNLTLDGEITVFKALPMSKIIHLALITNIAASSMKELNKTQKEFILKKKNSKVNYTTLCNNHDYGDLKMLIYQKY